MKSINKIYYFKAFGYPYTPCHTFKEAFNLLQTAGIGLEYRSIHVNVNGKDFCLYKDRYNDPILDAFSQKSDLSIEFYLQLSELK